MTEVQSRTSCEDLIKMKDFEIECIRKDLINRDKYIDRLEKAYCKEIEKLQNQLQQKEIERLNNIIKRLEEFIEREIEIYTLELTEKNTNALSYSLPIKGVYKEIYNVLQELKGGDKK